MPAFSSHARRLRLIAITIAIGCGSPSTEPGRIQPALTTLPRPLTGAETAVLGSANQFSFALWQTVTAAQPDSNIFVSPLSASFSLGMALNGASAQTFDEMRAGLQLGGQSLADIDGGYKSLIGLLTGLDPTVAMSIANSIWYRNTLAVNQSFVNDDATYFGATVKPLDFNDVAGSLATINAWVNAQTKGRIPTILDEIRPDHQMFLINAIYFKGSWRNKFDPAQTIDAPFHAATGDQPARLMHRLGAMAYGETPTYQAVDLPYGDSAFTMSVLLPKTGTSVDAVASSLDAAHWQTLASGFQAGFVDLYLPKFTMTWEHELIPSLETLGMRAPFSTSADFTRMSPSGRNLAISSVRQKTFVTVDEEGTEAAAVTSTGIVATSAPVSRVMRVDRPFIFLIRERLTGTVVFMGKVVRLP